MKELDESAENYTIKEIHEHDDSWSISTKEDTGFMIKKKWGLEPEVGDIVTLYTQGLSFIRGIDLNGQQVFYKTDAQLEAHHQKEKYRIEKEKEEKFVENKEKMDAQYDALPEVFRKRIARFRFNNPKFRQDYEEYELFCCEQAVIIANALKTPEKVKEFKEMDWESQMELIPEIDSGHSGNTFGCAIGLAYWYLNDADIVPKMHGALAPLVGSKEYGEFPNKE